MWSFENFQSIEFLFIVSISVLGTFFWVTYSLQEVLLAFRKSTKKRAKEHLREMAKLRENIKNRI